MFYDHVLKAIKPKRFLFMPHCMTEGRKQYITKDNRTRNTLMK